MNVLTDLEAINNAAASIQRSRQKLIEQAANIRTALAMIEASGVALNLTSAVYLLEDAAAAIECELNSNAGH